MIIQAHSSGFFSQLTLTLIVAQPFVAYLEPGPCYYIYNCIYIVKYIYMYTPEFLFISREWPIPLTVGQRW